VAVSGLFVTVRLLFGGRLVVGGSERSVCNGAIVEPYLKKINLLYKLQKVKAPRQMSRRPGALHLSRPALQ
jgi:hypothetical protein